MDKKPTVESDPQTAFGSTTHPQPTYGSSEVAQNSDVPLHTIRSRIYSSIMQRPEMFRVNANLRKK